jgi:hypothetical protein
VSSGVVPAGSRNGVACPRVGDDDATGVHSGVALVIVVVATGQRAERRQERQSSSVSCA